MAYYPSYGYQTNYYGQPIPDQLAQLRQNQMQQPMMQTQPAQIQPMPPQTQPSNPMTGNVQNNGILWVSGKQDADSYLVAPNSAVALWDANNPVIYLRQADSTGKPSTKVYDLVERVDNQPARNSTTQVDLSQYITRDELENILAERLKRTSKTSKVKEDTDNG